MDWCSALMLLSIEVGCRQCKKQLEIASRSQPSWLCALFNVWLRTIFVLGWRHKILILLMVHNLREGGRRTYYAAGKKWPSDRVAKICSLSAKFILLEDTKLGKGFYNGRWQTLGMRLNRERYYGGGGKPMWCEHEKVCNSGIKKEDIEWVYLSVFPCFCDSC